MKRIAILFLVCLLLVSCTPNESIQETETPVDKIERDRFISLYVDDINYQAGIYQLGDNIISYAFPITWDLSLYTDTIYLTEDTYDISYEIKVISSDKYKSIINNSKSIDKLFDVSLNMFGSEYKSSIGDMNIDVLQTGSASDFFSSVQWLYSYLDFNGEQYMLPYFVYCKVEGDNVLLIKVDVLSNKEFPITDGYTTIDELEDVYNKSDVSLQSKVDNYFIDLQSTSDKIKTNSKDFFKYLYYGFITAEEQGEEVVKQLGIYPYYKPEKMSYDSLDVLRNNESINTLVLRYKDIVLSTFTLDKFADTIMSDDSIYWNPIDGVYNGTSYTLSVTDVDDEEFEVVTLYAWAQNYLFDSSGVITNVENTVIPDWINISSEVIDTYSYCDELSYATMFTIDCNIGGVVFKLPIIFYKIEMGNYIIWLKSSMQSGNDRLTDLSKEGFEASIANPLTSEQLEVVDLFGNKFKQIEEYSKGLLRLLYNGNIMLLKEIEDINE